MHVNTMSQPTRAIITVGAAENTICRTLESDNNAVEAIGLCGLPRSGKTVLLESKHDLEARRCAFHAGSEAIAKISPGDLEARFVMCHCQSKQGCDFYQQYLTATRTPEARKSTTVCQHVENETQITDGPLIVSAGLVSLADGKRLFHPAMHDPVLHRDVKCLRH
jgi:hypothetical protein